MYTDPQNSQENKFPRNVISPFSMGFLEDGGSSSKFFYFYLITRRRIAEVSNSLDNGATFKPRKSKLLIVPFAHSKKGFFVLVG